MADIQVEAPADDIEFYTPGAGSKPGPYHAHVQKLLAADEARTDEQKAEGTHASLPITVPNVIEEADAKGEVKKFDGVARHKRYFQESARFLNLTAQEIDRKEGAENTVLRFVVKPLVKRPRKPADEPAVEVQVQDAPTEKTGGKARAPQAA